MNKRISLGSAVAFMLIIAAVTFSITMMVSLRHFNTLVLNVKNREEQYKKIADLDSKVRQNFDGTIDEERLLDNISRGYMRGLNDKYSTYLTKAEYEQRLKDLSGSQVGIGIKSAKDETGYIEVTKVFDGGPTKDILQPGDYIISINDTDLKNVTTDKINIALMGEVGTKVKIVYRRDGVDTPVDVIRTDFIIPVVEMKLIDTNAYIKISEFNDDTFTQFKNAVNNAVSSGATGLIFDLRNNTGESLEAATKILDLLLPSGIIAKTIDNNGSESILAMSDKYEIELPMVTIVNAKTASASELFAATLRDYSKGTSVGVNTYGKGVIQTLIKLTDGSAINLTTAHFYTSQDTSINEVGIKPDYEVKLTPEQEVNIDNLPLEQDPQLLKAIEVVNSTKPE